MEKIIHSKYCKHCNKRIPFKYPSDLKDRSFCNNLCKFAYNRSHPEIFAKGKMSKKRKNRNCIVCGKEFSFYPCEEKKNPCLYCSNKCWQKVRGPRITGKNHPRWKEHKHINTFRKWVRYFFKDLCAICGWDKTSNDICHIVPTKSGGPHSVENIIVLCPNHHRMFDQDKISMDEIIKARPNCLKSDPT